MAESIVKIPSTASSDYDFLAFSFNGYHSWDDFKIIRVSDGDRYNTELNPQLQDKTAENPGGDGTYFFGTNHKQKVFNINFAFEEIDDVTIRRMKQWLNGKELGDLWFEEEPYKVYTAKVTGQPTIKCVPFDYALDGTQKRVYRGEGTVQFTAYWPYAHTPDKIQKKVGSTWANVGNGKDLDSYTGFANKSLWSGASGLTSTTGACQGENPGDLPAPFVLSKDGPTDKGIVLKVGDLEVILNSDAYLLRWDSKTGIITSTNSLYEEDTRAPISFSGNSVGGIPVGDSIIWGYRGKNQSIKDISTRDMELKYHYWYY